MTEQTVDIVGEEIMTNQTVIEVRDVVKTYGEGESTVQVLRGVDLVVGRGEMLAIMGPSGSGKSTLLG